MNSTREGISHTKIDWHNWYQSLTANRTRQDMTTTTHFSTWVKDRVFSDGRFQFEFDSFSWNDASKTSTVNAMESRAHPLMLGMYQFMKYSGKHRTDHYNAEAAYQFFLKNASMKRNTIRGRGFRMCIGKGAYSVSF